MLTFVTTVQEAQWQELTAKAHAFLHARGFVTPQDVKSVAQDVLRHRVAVTFEAEAEEKNSETIIQKILDELPVP